MQKFAQMFSRLLNVVVGASMAVIVILVFINVVMRYLFNSGFTWSEEIALDLFIWVIFLGAVMAATEDLHIKVDLLTSKLPKKAQKALMVTANLAVLFSLGVLLDGGIKIVKVTHSSISPATGIPASYINVALVAFAVGVGIITIYRTYKDLRH